MLKKFIAREPDVEVNVVSTNEEDCATVAVASVIHQDVDPDLGEVPDLEGYRQREGVHDVKLGEEQRQDQRRALKDLIRRRIKLTNDV